MFALNQKTRPMQKLTIIILITLSATSFCSCKKDWKCFCSYGYNNNSVIVFEIKNKTKKEAKKDCSIYRVVRPLGSLTDGNKCFLE